MSWCTTIDGLKGCANFLQERIASGKPDVDLLAFGIATEFLRTFVDNEWTNQMVFGEHTTTVRRNRAGRNFMRAEFTEDDDGYRNQQRTLRVAELLFNLQNVEGFDDKLKDLRSGNVESSYSELETGAFLLRRAVQFKYITPSGIKGNDYDIEILLPNGEKLHCEIKCKVEVTALSEGAVRNSLEAARKQLPPKESGLVFLKLPEAWVTQSETLQIVSKAVNDCLRRTSRIMAVVLRWEEQQVQAPSNGALTLYKYRLELGSQPKPVTPSVGATLTALTGPSTAPLVSFREIAEEVLQK